MVQQSQKLELKENWGTSFADLTLRSRMVFILASGEEPGTAEKHTLVGEILKSADSGKQKAGEKEKWPSDGVVSLPDLLDKEFTSDAVNQRSFYVFHNLPERPISSEAVALEKRWLLQQNTPNRLDIVGPCYLQDCQQGWILKYLSRKARKVIKRKWF